jgi:hypothetical protein
MGEDKIVVKSGTSLSTILTIIFVVLKLCGIIKWSWLWVLSPIWISWTLVLIVCIIVILILKLL